MGVAGGVPHPENVGGSVPPSHAGMRHPMPIRRRRHVHAVVHQLSDESCSEDKDSMVVMKRKQWPHKKGYMQMKMILDMYIGLRYGSKSIPHI